MRSFFVIYRETRSWQWFTLPNTARIPRGTSADPLVR